MIMNRREQLNKLFADVFQIISSYGEQLTDPFLEFLNKRMEATIKEFHEALNTWLEWCTFILQQGVNQKDDVF